MLSLGIILTVFILTYCRLLGKDFYWVIDDLEGIARFSERWDANAKKKIDSYDINGKEHKFLSFIPELGFPGNVLRFLRLHIGKQWRVIGKNEKNHDVWGYVQSPIRHHLLSMVVYAANLVLGYFFLAKVLPEPIAFGAVLLFAVHPLGTQLVAWISGINYSLSLMFSLAMINIAVYALIPDLTLRLFSVGALSFLSTISLYVGGFSFPILLLLGFKWEALVAGIIGLGIVYIKGKETKDLRIAEFRKQNMAATTFLNWRKPIVMAKTLWYYMRCVFLPIKMGLYHVWGYFYEEPIERVDRMFFLGLLTLAAFIAAFIYGNLAIKLGILWYFTHFFIFSNFITAQQFVADRYVSIPAFGICIILASLFYGTPIFWLLVGAYAMRTFLHLPTFKNEVDFYFSNFLNFRKSEVSLGNLGVAYINQGMPGAAVDFWIIATKINPQYDVPWYNLYSVFKGNGRLNEAKDFLKRCLDAKIVHFQERWTKEMEELDKMIEMQKTPIKPTELFYHEAADHFKAGDTKKEEECLRKFITSDTSGLIPEMITQVKQRLAEIESSNKLRDPLPEPARPETSGSVTIDPIPGIPPVQS